MSLTPANTQSTSIVNLVFAVCMLKKMDIFKRDRRFRQVRRFRHFSSELSWFAGRCRCFAARAHMFPSSIVVFKTSSPKAVLTHLHQAAASANSPHRISSSN